MLQYFFSTREISPVSNFNARSTKDHQSSSTQIPLRRIYVKCYNVSNWMWTQNVHMANLIRSYRDQRITESATSSPGPISIDCDWTMETSGTVCNMFFSFKHIREAVTCHTSKLSVPCLLLFKSVQVHIASNGQRPDVTSVILLGNRGQPGPLQSTSSAHHWSCQSISGHPHLPRTGERHLRQSRIFNRGNTQSS